MSPLHILDADDVDAIDAAALEDTVTEEMAAVPPEEAGEIQMQPVVRIQEVRIRLEEILGGEDIY